MNIHEYQAKEILRKFGVAVPNSKVAFSAKEAEDAAKEYLADRPICVVKAQIHAGGRGKAGGVKLVKSAKEAGEVAEELLGKVLGHPPDGP